ncbi:integrin beta-PS isoform X2 [Tribolium madens]|uniref:integrin beta-PS isoform X2 n=1 Tax=Tribolium madens TaxID=41895 RepID=UPI001CF766EC|nr:integrin beta-PS isoform X2 [Tribolium madens]
MVVHITLLIGALLVGIQGQILQQFTQNPCDSRSTCHECIATPSCAWCYDTVNINTTKRCFQPSYPLPPLDKCDPSKIYNPDNEMIIVSNRALSSRTEAEGGTLVTEEEHSGGFHGGGGGGTNQGGGAWESGGTITQVRPQRIKLKLRARQTYSVNMYYTQAEDYPVDLYYLMDLSKSMEDDKEKLSALGDHLAQTMRNMTSKFMLGFGSFVDKVVMPYVSTIPENLRSPCQGCAAPYGFRNMMTLSRDTWQFSHMVKRASVSGNLDAPEGGFDAIMQAVVCREQIGWRHQARRLLVFSTDAGFHYAGDGKLGGIVKPNDGQCHLDQRGYYTMSSKQDYPSISQINTYVKKNSINVIFAVTAEKKEIYEQLKEHIEGSSCGQLSNDSSNVVDLITEQYQAISSVVEMKHNASGSVDVRFFSKCLNSKGREIQTNKCGNIKVGSLVQFRVQLEVLKCPTDPRDTKQLIQIYPVGLNESLFIDLTMLCDCPCEHEGFERNSPKCHNHGTYMCGICDCIEPAYGPYCECNKDGTSANISTANCINPKNGLECSGRGNCICGKCECEQRNNPEEAISGELCQCDNFSCERHNGLICSGPEHGTCVCGVCECKEGWMGDNCACRNATNLCIKPDSEDPTLICSGNGECECGICKCRETDEGRYFGRFCEHCPFKNCSDDCEKYRECVQCQQYQTGNLTEEECRKCPFTPTSARVVEVDEKNGEVLCPFYDEDDCRFSFVYYFDEENKIQVRAQEERECPATVFLLGIVLGVIAAVVLLGMAVLLLWKLFTTIHDRREFAKFEKEAMMARWDTGENPIYKQATSTFKNPTYAGKS